MDDWTTDDDGCGNADGAAKQNGCPAAPCDGDEWGSEAVLPGSRKHRRWCRLKRSASCPIWTESATEEPEPSDEVPAEPTVEAPESTTEAE